MASRHEAKPHATTPVPSSPDGRRAAAVDGSPQARSSARRSRFLAVAMELLEEKGDVGVTVQSIVERSQLSLRAFYQHFSSKDELLITLFEDLVTRFTDDLAAEVEHIDDPFDRLEAYVRDFLHRARTSRPFSDRAWTVYHMRLAADSPGDYAKSIARQIEVLDAMVEHGVEQGAFRSDLPAMAITLFISSTLVSITQMAVLGISTPGGPIGPDEVWSWCRAAVAFGKR